LRPRRARRAVWMIFEGNDLENSYARDADLAPRIFDQTLLGTLAVGLPALVRDGSVLGRAVRGGSHARASSPAADTRVDRVSVSSPLWRSARFGDALVFGPYLERAAMPESYVARHPNRPALEAAFDEVTPL